MNWDIARAVKAIKTEREEAQEPSQFLVRNIVRDTVYLRVKVEPVSFMKSRPLDEALEGSQAWWRGENSGSANVLFVDPDHGEIVLQYLSGDEPTIDAQIRIYPIDFLQPLEEAYQNPENAGYLTAAASNQATGKIAKLSIPKLNLRTQQQRAVSLANVGLGLLHGPPGTGKTYTIGALVLYAANVLKMRRILILAPTHTATDQALIAADQAFHIVGAEKWRRLLRRLGTIFDARRYHDRQHLLDQSNGATIDALVELEANQPSKGDIDSWKKWKADVDRLRLMLKPELEEVLEKARVVATTVSAVTFSYEIMRSMNWDLVIIDEASQVTGAAAILMRTIAKSAVFCGDPKQLAAVVQSNEPGPQKYLAKTAFDIFAGNAREVKLDEQSRMAPEIGAAVSELFYDGSLKVAADAKASKHWRKSREPFYVNGLKLGHIEILLVDEEAQWSRKYGGNIRWASKEMIVNHIDDLLGAGIAHEDILVLSPFRSQCALIRQALRARKVSGISVSTVHRSQGGERTFVLFDPVDGSSRFLNGPAGNRLLNVAFSRAKTHLIVAMSSNDKGNPKLAGIARLARNNTKRSSKAARALGKKAAQKLGGRSRML